MFTNKRPILSLVFASSSPKFTMGRISPCCRILYIKDIVLDYQGTTEACKNTRLSLFDLVHISKCGADVTESFVIKI